MIKKFKTYIPGKDKNEIYDSAGFLIFEGDVYAMNRDMTLNTIGHDFPFACITCGKWAKVGEKVWAMIYLANAYE